MGTGLLLVDIQNDYFPNGRMPLSGMDLAAQHAARLLTLFRNAEWPTFHIQHIADKSDAPFFRPDTEGAELHISVKPLTDNRIITKHFPNSFRETDLFQRLEKSGVGQLVICGAMSHMCIDATTRAAADLGFNCIVVHDACATRELYFGSRKIDAENVHGAFMAALRSTYAQVMNCEGVVQKMQTDKR